MSAAHHDMASTPLLWPENSCAGEILLRRSHTCSVVDRSSSEAVMSCVATSGFHASAEQRRAPLGSVKLITGRCRFKSHTTVVPPADVEARMCCTLQFQARKVTSPAPPVAVLPPLSAGYSDGAAGLARSQMHSSPSAAPDARSAGLNGLNCKPLTCAGESQASEAPHVRVGVAGEVAAQGTRSLPRRCAFASWPPTR